MKRVLLFLFCAILCVSFFGCACAECDNQEFVDCPVEGCSGGILYCSDCDGKGVLNARDCYRCDNHSGYSYGACKNCKYGYITNPITWQQFPCGVCNGQAIVKELCEPCNGMGYIGEDCPNCYDGDWQCEECDGKGTVPCPSCQDVPARDETSIIGKPSPSGTTPSPSDTTPSTPGTTSYPEYSTQGEA